MRQVLVRSATGVFRRDVRKLCLLEEELLKSIEESMEKNKTGVYEIRLGTAN